MIHILVTGGSGGLGREVIAKLDLDRNRVRIMSRRKRPANFVAYSVAFFDKYLKGQPSPLLDGPSKQYPEVVFESRGS